MKVTLPAGITLRHCPFCGSDDVALKSNQEGHATNSDGHTTRQQFWVKCQELQCGATTDAVPEQDWAVKKWNKRAVVMMPEGVVVLSERAQ